MCHADSDQTRRVDSDSAHPAPQPTRRLRRREPCTVLQQRVGLYRSLRLKQGCSTCTHSCSQTCGPQGESAGAAASHQPFRPRCGERVSTVINLNQGSVRRFASTLLGTGQRQRRSRNDDTSFPFSLQTKKKTNIKALKLCMSSRHRERMNEDDDSFVSPSSHINRVILRWWELSN